MYKSEKKINSKSISMGSIVEIPFRNQYVNGIVLQEIADEKNIQNELKKQNIAPEKVREISYIYDLEPILTEKFLKFLEVVSRYYMIDMASIAKLVIPIKIKKDTSKNLSLKEKNKKKEINCEKFTLPSLSAEQQIVYNEINNLNRGENVILLKGVTGSGKTEIYFQKIAEILAAGKQVLLMLPEIGLTSQILSRFERCFGFMPSLWHSAISSSKKAQIYENIAKGEEKIIIGARSSLFLPYKNLGLIIIDEEHDSSYKQEDGILYNARDCGVLRAHYEDIPIILVSATPSIESYKNAIDGKYKLFELSNRYSGISMPLVHIINMKNEGKKNILSDSLIKAAKDSLTNGGQILFFLNRKGYAPLVLCRSCGYRFACKYCSSWLVYHKNNSKFLCHYCGYKEEVADICPSCNEDALINFGFGIEKILEESKKIFPEARIVNITKDELGSEKKIEELIRDIEVGKYDIIIGTQIITKGYHFPKLNLVGVIDIDLGLSNIDLKASERCFQILKQVGGRAGRESVQGNIYIQTYYPEDVIINAISNNSEKDFYDKELEERKKQNLPPYSRIAAILITGKNEQYCKNFSQNFCKAASKTKRVNILGPAPASLNKLKGGYRYRIIVISDKNFNIQNYLNEWISKIQKSSQINVKIEIDPNSFY